MANPNPSPETRFKPGHASKGGAPRGKRATTVLLELIAEKNADQAIAIKWLQRILAGDFRFFREYLDRTEGKVPDRIAVSDDEPECDVSRLSLDERRTLLDLLAKAARKPDRDDAPA